MLHEIFKGMDNAAEQINENFEMVAVERGDTANGEYIKYANGLVVCTHAITRNARINQPYGALYREANDSVWEYPIEFETLLYCNVNGNWAAPLAYINNADESSLTYRGATVTSASERETDFKCIAVGILATE